MLPTLNYPSRRSPLLPFRFDFSEEARNSFSVDDHLDKMMGNSSIDRLQQAVDESMEEVRREKELEVEEESQYRAALAASLGHSPLI